MNETNHSKVINLGLKNHMIDRPTLLMGIVTSISSVLSKYRSPSLFITSTSFETLLPQDTLSIYHELTHFTGGVARKGTSTLLTPEWGVTNLH